MDTQLPVASRFARPALAVPSTEPRLPYRLWMTGSLAVVMAALVPMQATARSPRSGSMRLLCRSPFGVGETLQRIETAAEGQGLRVLARLGGAAPAIVLASSVGGTPVLMEEVDSRPVMPLGLLLRDDGSGGAAVFGGAGAPLDRRAWRELPEAVIRDVAALAQVLQRALG